MSTEDVAMRLVELCKGKDWKKAIDDLYAKDIVSIEPRAMENMPAEMRGIDVRGGHLHCQRRQNCARKIPATGGLAGAISRARQPPARDSCVINYHL